MEPLRKKLVTAVAIKDAATAKIKAVTNKIKAAGKMIAKPVVNVVVKGAQALSAVGKGILKITQFAAAGASLIGAGAAAELKALYAGSEEAAKAQIEAETKLTAVLGNVKSIQAQGAGAAVKAKKELMGVASNLQKVGVIGDEVTLAGMQQLATFQLSQNEISTLAGGMTDLLAQQKGLNASQGDAVNIANMIGKAMTGQTGALSRVGISFTEAQAKALKVADTEERAAILAEILQQNVGGVNKALAETEQGKIQQVANAFGDMKEEVGKLALSVKSKFAAVINKNIPTIQKIGESLMGAISTFADAAMPVIDKVLSNVGPKMESVFSNLSKLAKQLAPVLSVVFKGFGERAKATKSVIEKLVQGFAPLLPKLTEFGTSVFAAMQKLTASVMPVIDTVITSVQAVLPDILPVLTTVITAVTDIISQAAPIISGLVEGIGSVISALAPVFNTIFGEIGAKVGSVIGFVSERMDFIKEVFNTAGPMISDILSTAWSVISPIIDIAISMFEVIFAVVQKVFPGIQATIQTVWNIVKPLIEGIGTVMRSIAEGWNWLVGKVSGGGDVGHNAGGTDDWRGGPTWVGERGPELVYLPRHSKVIPNRESMSIVAQQRRKQEEGSIIPFPTAARKPEPTQSGNKSITLKIDKLADSIVVREEADIDKVGESVAKKVVEALENIA